MFINHKVEEYKKMSKFIDVKVWEAKTGMFFHA